MVRAAPSSDFGLRVCYYVGVLAVDPKTPATLYASGCGNLFKSEMAADSPKRVIGKISFCSPKRRNASMKHWKTRAGARALQTLWVA